MVVFLQALIRIHFELRKEQSTVEMEIPCVHFVETSASLLQEMPSLIHRDYKVHYTNKTGHYCIKHIRIYWIFRGS